MSPSLEAGSIQEVRTPSLYRLELFDSEDKSILQDVIFALDAHDAGVLAYEALRLVSEARWVRVSFTREDESFSFRLKKVLLN